MTGAAPAGADAAHGQLLLFAILLGALVLFASGRLRHDVVALIALAAVGLSGLTPESEIFAGFGHPATITVMAVLMISAALNRSGVVTLFANALAPHTKRRWAHLLLLTGAVAVLSAFINNVGALALMMPVALATAQEHDRDPGILLMPLAFAAILGGMTTLIGTPPNIIVSSIRAEAVGAPYALFDFAPVGLLVATLGVAFVALIGWRLLPRRAQDRSAQERLFEVGAYLAELRVPEGSALVGKPLSQLRSLFDVGAQVLAIERTVTDADGVQRVERLPAFGFRPLRAGDLLLTRAPPELLAKAVSTHGLELRTEAGDRALRLDREVDWRDAALVEVVVGATSPLIGRAATIIDRISGGAASLLALARAGAEAGAGPERLRTARIAAGDALLIQGEPEAIAELTRRQQLWPLAERGLRLGGADRPALVLAVFAAALALALLGVASIGVCFILAVVVYVVIGALPVRELYDGVDWSVIVLLGAMFPLGAAMEATGATVLLADGVAQAAGAAGLPAWAVLTLVLVLTMFLSDVINNAATAVLMAPIAIDIAAALGAAPDPFLMAVAVGASCAFLTPIGHQCNTLVMGPGGYRFTDYWRMGLPLELLIVAVAVPMILLVWPL
ncbi:MAG: SLC13 family permease [Pseudomonadota bacterium]